MKVAMPGDLVTLWGSADLRLVIAVHHRPRLDENISVLQLLPFPSMKWISADFFSNVHGSTPDD